MLFALRYYDLDNSGHTNVRQFRQFLTKFGIHHYSLEESQALFDSYDWDRRGIIDHKDLINRILENKTTQIVAPSKEAKEPEISGPRKVDATK